MAAWRDYERLVRDVVERLSSYARVATTRVEHDVLLEGLATTHQIDVLWEFVDANGVPHRLVLDAKHHKEAVHQQVLLAQNAITSDLAAVGVSTFGGVVTTRGFQSGATHVAETYGLLVLELRGPSEQDLEGRATKLSVDIHVQAAFVESFDFEIEEVYVSDDFGAFNADDATIDLPDGTGRQPLVELLVEGELGLLGQPAAPHLVVRKFDLPRVLSVAGTRIASVSGVRAMVGERSGVPATAVVDGLQSLGLLLRNALNGRRVWMAEDGRIWSTDS